jgi:hypothetical protein
MEIWCLRFLRNWTIYHSHMITDRRLGQLCSRGFDMGLNPGGLHIESKGRPYAELTVYTNLATLQLYKLTANKQTETGTWKSCKFWEMLWFGDNFGTDPHTAYTSWAKLD